MSKPETTKYPRGFWGDASVKINPPRNETPVAARAAFEEWARSRGMYAARRDGEYPESATRFAWDVWIAAWEKKSQHEPE